jgi:class 3 adenylate cyclase/putative methionine-R-sulfoxide reductase with GAF domain
MTAQVPPSAPRESTKAERPRSDAEAELERLRREAAAGHTREAAVGAILRVMADSPTNLRRVLDAVAENAARLCDAHDAQIWQVIGDARHKLASHGTLPTNVSIGEVRQNSLASVAGRAALEGRTIHVSDLQAQEGEAYAVTREGTAGLGVRTILATPLLRREHAIGLIVIRRTEVRPFSAEQIRLLETFADQAAIAIEQARLLETLEERNRDLAAALEQQTATAEVLRVIASSPTDLQRVLDTVAASAARLCGADDAVIRRRHGEVLLQVAHHGTIPAGDRIGEGMPIAGTVSGQAVADRRTIHVHDLAAESDYPVGRAYLARSGHRTMLATPLLREGVPIGSITIRRLEVRPFTEQQIRLLETFADQAVIAIENTRLFDELSDVNRTLEARVREQVEELERVGRLRRYLSPQLAELIVSSGDETILESHRRQVTVVFCDLRGFTAFAEVAEPEEVMGVLAEYHAALGMLIHASSGTIEHFAGDGVMVFFNDPLPQPDHVERAVRMAVAMRERVQDLTRRWRRQGHELGFGVGIALGYATLGRIGFEGRFDYAAIGTVCNLAARLCGEATDGQILLSSRALGVVEDLVEVEHLGELTLKGFHRPTRACNVLDLRADRAEAGQHVSRPGGAQPG